jgi:Ni,Fe-hydrogenase maturation factor
MAAAMNAKPKNVLLVGCEPLTFGGEEGYMGLSEPVEAAVDEAAKMVNAVLEKVLQPKRKTPGLEDCETRGTRQNNEFMQQR